MGYDKLWNLVPTFSRINCARKNQENKKLLLEYLDINTKLTINEIFNVKSEINQLQFNEDLKNTIMPLYQIAYNQGFDEWSYEKYELTCKKIQI